jgi:hypothetical protein
MSGMRFVQAGAVLLGAALYLGYFLVGAELGGFNILPQIVIGFNALLSIVTIFVTIDSVRKVRAGKTRELATDVFVVKLTAIPFFVINFGVGAMAGLFGAVTLIHGIGMVFVAAVAIGTVLTYLTMLSTSIYGWASVIRLRREGQISRFLVVLYTILLFVFVADTVVGILLFVHYRRSRHAAIEDVKSPVESITAD